MYKEVSNLLDFTIIFTVKSIIMMFLPLYMTSFFDGISHNQHKGNKKETLQIDKNNTKILYYVNCKKKNRNMISIYSKSANKHQ